MAIIKQAKNMIIITKCKDLVICKKEFTEISETKLIESTKENLTFISLKNINIKGNNK